MSSSPRYTEEFKFEAIKQIIEHHHSVADVAGRLGISSHSLYAWAKRYGAQNLKSANHYQQAKNCEGVLTDNWQPSYYDDCLSLEVHLDLNPAENRPESSSEQERRR